ncbi:hypothetical protein CF336_g5035 [Tilletia laevis]|uniref:Transmembrane protein n=2 Tax=Tilletia TaxID=13289 RepID=A0A177U1Y0_9BASI|nr:hypothetical protein CF328_g6799 [Tilletia controversa]KAE8189701.1 hypothetical protein CF335_g6556 [Tilletia laevis]KAE8191048.1 hypothetical protein CF336_g5035 [Tilletia laevis]KAE8250306.1 hypothetical protein A4X03_0g6468 [Tilletia caries]
MQIRRSSHLSFLLSAVFFCSMAVALVAAAPAPASASSYGLEHHPVGSFLKRALPDLTVLDTDALGALYDAREDFHQHILNSIAELEGAGGNQRALEALRIEEAEAAAEMERIAAELQRTELRL